MSSETPENGDNVVKLSEVIKKRRGRPKKERSGPVYPRDVPGFSLDGLDLEILAGLDIDEDEKPFRTAFNLYRIVSQFSASRDIHFCELNGELRFGDDAPPFALPGAVVKKEDFTRIRILISGCFGLDFRIADLTQAVEAYGDGRRRDPVKDWLLDCRTKWQDKQRREQLPDDHYTDWLTRFAGAPAKRIYNRIGEMWLTSVAARGLQPGVQSDCMMILKGASGTGKTSLIRALVPEPSWLGMFGEGTRGTEAARQLTGKLIILDDEMIELGYGKLQAGKKYLSLTADQYRRLYNNTQITLPRRVAFCGTTDRDEFLKDDPAGHRRFWVVPVGIMDLARLKEERDYLMGWAVANFKRGVTFHPSADDNRLLDSIAKDHVAEDPWKFDVLGEARSIYDIGGRRPTTNEIFGRLVNAGLPREGADGNQYYEKPYLPRPNSAGRESDARIKSILRADGWVERRDGAHRQPRLKRWCPPGDDGDEEAEVE